MQSLSRYIILIVAYMLIPSWIVTANAASANFKTTLISLESEAEDMVDATLAKDVMASQKLYNKIQTHMDELYQDLENKPFNERRSRELLMIYSWMRVISIDLKQKAWVGAAIAANQLSASIIQFTNYPTLWQRDIAWLDFLARELLLLNMEDAKANAQLLDVRRMDIAKTWARIDKSLLLKNFNNKKITLIGNSIVHRIQDDYAVKASMMMAQKLLDFVDDIEQVK
ncbi:MAG: hypothetical protein JKY87_03770 [Mariprofundus sp.]|nr:hypothetical protein [Mariprofundus sp.]